MMNSSKQAAMDNKIISALLVSLAFWSIPYGEGQQAKKVIKIGFLGTRPAFGVRSVFESVRRILGELGYVEGKDACYVSARFIL
jgi:aspartate aminotransferase-like enzyme